MWKLIISYDSTGAWWCWQRQHLWVFAVVCILPRHQKWVHAGTEPGFNRFKNFLATDFSSEQLFVPHILRKSIYRDIQVITTEPEHWTCWPRRLWSQELGRKTWLQLRHVTGEVSSSQKLDAPNQRMTSSLLDHFLESNRFTHVGQPRSMIVQHIEIHKIECLYESIISSLTYHLSIWPLPGIQNGITRRCLSLPICTTHFTGYLTDVGTGLGLWARETLNGNNPPTLLKAEREGWKKRMGTIRSRRKSCSLHWESLGFWMLSIYFGNAYCWIHFRYWGFGLISIDHSFRSVLSRSKKIILKALHGGQNACGEGTWRSAMVSFAQTDSANQTSVLQVLLFAAGLFFFGLGLLTERQLKYLPDQTHRNKVKTWYIYIYSNIYIILNICTHRQLEPEHRKFWVPCSGCFWG